jgi:hypothetical protein
MKLGDYRWWFRTGLILLIIGALMTCGGLGMFGGGSDAYNYSSGDSSSNSDSGGWWGDSGSDGSGWDSGGSDSGSW